MRKTQDVQTNTIVYNNKTQKESREVIENITLWTTIATSAISIVSTIIAIFTNKKKNKSQKIVTLAKIVQKLPEFIQEAEKIFGAGTGTAKKAWVLNKIQMECLQNKIEYNESEFGFEIEKILTTPTKKEDT